MKKEKKEMEKCVLCGKETSIPRDMHIDLRKHYIEGAGQLCDKCGDNELP